MSCSAKAAPPVPWNAFTGPVDATCPTVAAGAAAAGAAAPAGGVGAGPVCATAELMEASTPCAAVMVMPALVSPPTKPRREIRLCRYFTTSSRILVSLEICEFVATLRDHWRSRSLAYFVVYLRGSGGFALGPKSVPR